MSDELSEDVTIEGGALSGGLGGSELRAESHRRVGVEVVFEVLEPGHQLSCNLALSNESGIRLFGTTDLDPQWRRPRAIGRFTSTAWIPGNFLAEGAFLVGASISTSKPFTFHLVVRDVVGFHVTDPLEGGSARGDWDGEFAGLVRPLLPWTTTFNSDAPASPPL